MDTEPDAVRYEKLSRADSFNFFIDLALDGVITREQAISAYKQDVFDEPTEDTQWKDYDGA